MARQVDTSQASPLPPPATATRWWRGRSPRGRRGTWLALAASATAMIAVVLSLVAIRNTAVSAAARVAPQYYVTVPVVTYLAQNQAVRDAIVTDTFTDSQVTTVPAPAGWGFVSVAAASDDRTFVVGAGPWPDTSLNATRWYVIHLTPGAAPFASLRQLPIPAPQPGLVYRNAYTDSGMILSPDGTMLALLAQGTAALELRIYSTVTGELMHTWSVSSGPPTHSTELSLLSWAGGQLALQVQWPASRMGIRLLRVDDPGHGLLADSRVFQLPAACNTGFLFAADGKTLVCASNIASSRRSSACLDYLHQLSNVGIFQYSTATGKLTGSLYRAESVCEGVGLLWTNAAGNAAIGIMNSGRALFTPGKVTPLFTAQPRDPPIDIPPPAAEQAYPVADTAW